MQKYRKAIAGLVTPVVTWAIGWLVLHVGLDVDAATTAYIATTLSGLITGELVRRIPNEA